MDVCCLNSRFWSHGGSLKGFGNILDSTMIFEYGTIGSSTLMNFKPNVINKLNGAHISKDHGIEGLEFLGINFCAIFFSYLLIVPKSHTKEARVRE